MEFYGSKKFMGFPKILGNKSNRSGAFFVLSLREVKPCAMERDILSGILKNLTLFGSGVRLLHIHSLIIPGFYNPLFGLTTLKFDMIIYFYFCLLGRHAVK